MTTARKLFIWVLLGKLAILALVVGVWGESRLVWGDGVSYLQLGKSIFSGGGFSREIQIMPLYPFVVGLFDTYISHGVLILSIMQAIAAAGIAVLVYKLGLFIMPARYAIFAAIGTSFEPVASILHLLVMTETFLVFLLVLFTYFFIKYLEQFEIRYLIGAASVLAVSVLIKAVGVYLFIVPVVFILFHRRFTFAERVVRAFLFWAVFAVILMPWMYRNYVLVGEFKITQEGSGNICGYQLPLIFAVDRGINITTQSVTSDSEFQNLLQRCETYTEAENLFWVIKDYPYAFFKANTLATLSLFTNDGFATLFQKAPPGLPPHHNFLTPMVFMGDEWRQNLARGLSELTGLELSVLVVGKLFRLLLSIAAFCGIYALLKYDRSPYATFMLLVFVYLISVTVFSTALAVGARLRFPIDPFLFLFGLFWVSRRATGGNRSKISTG